VTGRLGSADATAVVLQAASVCLQYPDPELLTLLPVVEDAVRQVPQSGATRHLLEFLATARATEPLELQEHYVRTLDQRRRCCLYLTWWTEGETRRRGLALAELKELYRAHGFTLVGDELPDFLPVVLEFAAQSGHAGLALLRERRAAVVLVRLSLLDAGSPYAAPVQAVCDLLPGPSPRDAAAARALARTGPPDERVGLETYGTIGGEPFGALAGAHATEGVRR
jgi:nitrate reductase delta subunit